MGSYESFSEDSAASVPVCIACSMTLIHDCGHRHTHACMSTALTRDYKSHTHLGLHVCTLSSLLALGLADSF